MIAAAARLRSINQPSDRALLRAAPHGGGRPTCRSVVLPLPDAPMMASKLPLSTAPLTPCRIRRLPVPSLSHVTSRKLRHAPSVPLAITMSGRGSPRSDRKVWGQTCSAQVDLEMQDHQACGFGFGNFGWSHTGVHLREDQEPAVLETRVVTGSPTRDRLAGGTRRQAKGWTPHSWRTWTGRSPASWTATRSSRTRSCASARRYALPCSPPRAKYVPAASDQSCAHLALRRTATAGHMPRADCSAVE